MSDLFRIVEGDAVTFLRSLASESVDLIITDPAYESLEKHRNIGTTTRLGGRARLSRPKHGMDDVVAGIASRIGPCEHEPPCGGAPEKNPWFAIFPNARFGELFLETHRVLKRHAHLYLFSDQETMFVAKPVGEQVGFKFWKPIVWDKVAIGMGYHYRARYEFVLFFEKGKRKISNLGTADVLVHKRIVGLVGSGDVRAPAGVPGDGVPRRNAFPTEKPVELLETLVTQSSSPGQLIVDPFAGSGSTGVAALKHGRRFLGNDLDPSAVELATIRCATIAGGLAAPSTSTEKD